MATQNAQTVLIRCGEMCGHDSDDGIYEYDLKSNIQMGMEYVYRYTSITIQ